MALLSPAPVLQPIERTRCQDFRLASLMESRSGGRGEIEEEVPRVDEGEVPPVYEEEVPCVDEEKIYVALGKDEKENKPLLVWALQHSEGKKICILHVHQPAKMIPLMGGWFAADKSKEEEVTAYRESEKKKTHNTLNEYLRICARQGVQAEKLDAEMDSIEKGIIYLISQHRIKRLIMGSAAEKQNTKKMTMLKSKKAGEGRLDGREITVTESQLPSPTAGANSPISGAAGPITAATQRGHVKSRSLAEGQSDRARLSMVQAFFRRVSSHGGRVTTVHSLEGTGGMPMQQGQLATEGSPGGWEDVSRSPSEGSTHSTWSPSEDMFGSLESTSLARVEGSEDGAALSSIHESEEDTRRSSPLPEERRVNNEMINQLQQATAEAKNSVREAFEESVRRRKAEKEAMEAICKAKASERLYADEVRRRKELEEALARETVELNKIKSQRDEVLEELRTALDQKAVLESQLADSDRTVQELEEKIVSAVELLISIKDERDGLLLECDNADREAEELRKRSEEGTACSQRPHQVDTVVDPVFGRQAELLERGRLKKLRQKEQKAKEQTEGDEEESPDSSECLPSGETSSLLITSSWKDLTDPAEQNLEPVSVLNTNEKVRSRFQTGFDDAHIECGRGAEEQNGDQMQQGSSWRHQIVARRPVSSSHRGGRNGFHLGQPHPVSKLGPVLKQGTHKDQRVASLANGHKDQSVATLANGHKDQKAPSLNNGHKVWTRKTKPDIEVENLNARVQRESRDQPELNENHVLIGSISVTLRDSNGWCEGAIPAAPVDQCALDNQHPRPESGHEKHVKPDFGQSGSNKSMVKLWRPVGRHDAGNTVAVQYKKREVEVDTDASEVGNTSCASDRDNNVAGRLDSSAGLEEPENPRGLRLLSSRDAEAFLA